MPPVEYKILTFPQNKFELSWLVIHPLLRLNPTSLGGAHSAHTESGYKQTTQCNQMGNDVMGGGRYLH